MIAHSNGFKNAITSLGRELYVKINYYNVAYNIQTEDEKLILTQNNLELLTEDMEGLTPAGELTNEDIISLNKNNLGELFRTYMKSFDLETTKRFNVGDKMIINIGTKVDDDIEYLNYGKYYVYSKTYNEDKKTFIYTLCDMMLFIMTPYDNNAVFENDEDLTCEEMIAKILNLCNVNYNISTLVNGNRIVHKGTFAGLEITNRDVLDMVMQSQGCSLIVDYDMENDIDTIIDKSYNSQVMDIINSDILSDKNIKINTKFGPLNSLLFKRASGLDNIERKDDSSIATNGITQYVIENNLILDQDNRDTYIDNLFNKIKGIEYYTCDIDTIGIGYLEYLDMFEVRTPENIYKCLCLKNTSEISSGMKENFTTEEPVEKTKEYESGAKDDKSASIMMDKLKGTIILKVDSNGKISQVRLDGDADEGSLVEITADQINLAGKDINLTGDNITISSDNFNVDENGNMSCNDASINNASVSGNIDLTSVSTNSKYTIKDSENSNCKYEQSARLIRWYGMNGGLFQIWNTLSTPQLSINDNSTNSVSINGWSILVSNGTSTSSITPTSITPGSSLVETKKNIEDDVNALEIINDIDIYSYNYKNEEDGYKKHIGFIIGDDYKYSSKVTSINEDGNEIGADIYSFISVCCKAIQEQQKQIEELKEEINKLKEVK